MSGLIRASLTSAESRRYLVAIAASIAAALLTIVIDFMVGPLHAVAAMLAAILLTGWYAGTGPAILALLLAVIIDRLAPMLTGWPPSPWMFGIRDIWFILFAAAAAHFGAERRRANDALQRANDNLEREVALRTEELRRKQRYLDEAERLSHTGCWTFNLRSGGISFWSEETFRIFGMPVGSVVPTMEQLRTFMHPKDMPDAMVARQSAIQEGRPWDFQHRIIRPDGDIRYVRTVGQPYFDEHGVLVEYIGCVMDVTERRRMERALRRSHERTMRLRFQARLAERSRIAREMHDTLLQGFTGVALKLVATANSLGESAEANQALHDVIGLAQRTLADARNAIWDIRAPSGSSDLPAALRAEAERALQGSEVSVQVDVTGDVRPLPSPIAAVVLRVAREAVTNAVRHAESDVVRLQLRYGRHLLRLTVSDRGRGFAVDPELRAYGGHLGLLGMRERATDVGGRLTIQSAPGQGTTVRLTVAIPSSRRVLQRLQSGRNVAQPEPRTDPLP